MASSLDICGRTWLRHMFSVNDVATFVPTKLDSSNLYSEDDARFRLKLGMTCVGFWTLCASFFLLSLPQWRDANLSFATLIALGGVCVGIQFIFDILGAKGTQRGVRGLGDSGLIRGILIHSTLMALFAGATLESYRNGLTPSWTLGLLLPTWFMMRPVVLRLVSGIPLKSRRVASRPVMTFKSKAPTFTGGPLGLSAKSPTVIPEKWIHGLGMNRLRAELKRREWRTERRLALRSMLILTAWNILGCELCYRLLGLGALDPELATLSHAAAMTLWAFFALLTLPSLSRGAVFAADHAALDSGLDVEEWIRLAPTMTGENGSPNSLVQRVFYPIPSTKERLERLTRKAPSTVLGMLARDNLYLSWPTLSPLGRAVHCNLGAPDLWVYPPDA